MHVDGAVAKGKCCSASAGPKNVGRMQNNDKKNSFFLHRSDKFGVSWYEYHDCNFRHAIGGIRHIRYDWFRSKYFVCARTEHRMHWSYYHILL